MANNVLIGYNAYTMRRCGKENHLQYKWFSLFYEKYYLLNYD